MLSNMVNSSIHSVAVFTSHKNRSLMNHVGSGKQWDLDRKRDGLFYSRQTANVTKMNLGLLHTLEDILIIF